MKCFCSSSIWTKRRLKQVLSNNRERFRKNTVSKLHLLPRSASKIAPRATLLHFYKGQCWSTITIVSSILVVNAILYLVFTLLMADLSVEQDDSRPSTATYDFSKSTEENFAIRDREEPVFVGKYAKERESLDYNYHKHYNSERQLLQDTLMDRFHDTVVHDTENNTTCDTPLENWMVFTAGTMGAGKGHTIHWLASQGLFPLSAFVRVDPDMLRELLPELPGYILQNPSTAGYMTQKEAGYIAEVLSLNALQRGKNVLVDGSLRQAEWYRAYITNLHNRFSKLRFAIIQVTAKETTIFERVERRTKVTGRVVPRELLLETMQQIPSSLRILAPYVDYVATFANENNATEPVLLWSSKRPSPSSNDLSMLATFGEPSHGARVGGSNDQHRLLYNMEGNGQVSERLSGAQLDETEALNPSDDWKPIFKAIWKMHCPIPTSRRK